MGKPFAGQPGGGFGQGQQGGGFGNLAGSFQNFMGRQGGPQQSRMMGAPQQSRMMGAPQPQMSPQPMGGGMGAFQDFMRQQQMGQQSRIMGAPQPQMPPQPMGGGLSGLVGGPQQGGNRDYNTGQLGQFSNILRDLPQQPAGAPQQSQMSPQQMQSIMSAFAARQPQQAPEQPMLAPGGDRDFYTRQAPQQQNLDQDYADFMRQQQMSQNPGGFGGLSQLAGAPQQPAGAPQRSVSITPQQLQQIQMAGAPQQPAGAPQPMVSFPPQQLQSMMGAMRFSDGGAVAEDPRMQAMRSIQQLANRQRGY